MTRSCVSQTSKPVSRGWVLGARVEALCCLIVGQSDRLKARPRLLLSEIRTMQVSRRLRGNKLRATAFAKPFHCPHCEKSFAHRGNLVTHVRQVHSGTYDPPTCGYCGVTRASADNLRRHIIRKHTERPPRLRCPYPLCKKSFKTAQDRRQHVKLVHMHQQRKFQCMHCDYAAKTRSPCFLLAVRIVSTLSVLET